jgi:hypothetical protein
MVMLIERDTGTLSNLCHLVEITNTHWIIEQHGLVRHTKFARDKWRAVPVIGWVSGSLFGRAQTRRKS